MDAAEIAVQGTTEEQHYRRVEEKDAHGSERQAKTGAANASAGTSRAADQELQQPPRRGWWQRAFKS